MEKLENGQRATVKNVVVNMVENWKASGDKESLVITPDSVVVYMATELGIKRSAVTVENYLSRGELGGILEPGVEPGSWTPIEGGFHPYVDPQSHVHQVRQENEKPRKTNPVPGKARTRNWEKGNGVRYRGE